MTKGKERKNENKVEEIIRRAKETHVEGGKVEVEEGERVKLERENRTKKNEEQKK